jgi:predicted nucleic acid-binding protein
MMTLETLKNNVSGKKVLIDTNIIIYLTDEIQPYHPLSQELFTMIEQGKTKAVISILSVSEVMQGPIKAGKTNLAFEVRDYLLNFPNSQCQYITYDIVERIGNDARINWKVLRSVDSLIIACGLYTEVDLFISNDRHFIKALPSSMLLTFDH